MNVPGAVTVSPQAFRRTTSAAPETWAGITQEMTEGPRTCTRDASVPPTMMS